MRALVALLTTVILGSASAARADGITKARLVYERGAGAEDCPEEAAVRAAVVARLGYDPFVDTASSTLRATIGRSDSTYRADVKLVDDGDAVRGARTLEHRGARCADLVDAMALTISIAIDPRSLDGPVSAAPAAASLPPAPEKTPAEHGSPRPVAAGASLHLDGHALGGVWVGAAPNANAGLVAGLELLYRSAALAIDARVDGKSSIDVAQATVGTRFTGASLAPCFAPGIFRACGLFAIGELVATSKGITTPKEDSALHVLGGVRAGLVVPLAPPLLHLRGQVDLAYAFTPQIVRIGGQDVYTLDRLSIGGAIGLGVSAF